MTILDAGLIPPQPASDTMSKWMPPYTKKITLSTTATTGDVKALVDSFFEASELSWQNFKHICADGAPAMIGVQSGLVTLEKNEWPHVTSSLLLTTLIHFSIKDYTSTSTFDGSYRRRGQSDQLHSFGD